MNLVRQTYVLASEHGSNKNAMTFVRAVLVVMSFIKNYIGKFVYGKYTLAELKKYWGNLINGKKNVNRCHALGRDARGCFRWKTS
jgi:hypothetical protein